jgi:hypothetical protein
MHLAPEQLLIQTVGANAMAQVKRGIVVNALAYSRQDSGPFASGRPHPVAIRAVRQDVVGIGAQDGPDSLPLSSLQPEPSAISEREGNLFTGNLGLPTEVLGTFEGTACCLAGEGIRDGRQRSFRHPRTASGAES